MTDNVMDKVVIYSNVFEIFLMLLLAGIALALIADMMKNIYEIKNKKIDYPSLIRNI